MNMFWHDDIANNLSAADLTNPQTWNRYAYVKNNPVNAVDTTGLACYPVERNVTGSCDFWANLEGWVYGASWRQFDIVHHLYGWVDSVTRDENGNVIATDSQPLYANDMLAVANNQSLWGYLASKPWVVSWILPVAGPVPGVVGVGPAGGVAWNPKTHNLCIGLGLGASAGHNAAIGPLTTSSGNVDSILGGWSVSGGANLPFPSPAAGLGWQVIANSSGVAQGPTAGVAGLSGSVTWSACANLF